MCQLCFSRIFLIFAEFYEIQRIPAIRVFSDGDDGDPPFSAMINPVRTANQFRESMLSTLVPVVGKRRARDRLGREFFYATTIKSAAGNVYDSSIFGSPVLHHDYLSACLLSYLQTLSHRSVGAIKGFLVKELPARSQCVNLGFEVF
jgi:hypothetical protein